MLLSSASKVESASIKAKLDECFSQSFRVCTDTGDYLPHVCCICDRFTKIKDLDVVSLTDIEKYSSLLEPKQEDNIEDALLDCYRLELEEDENEVLNGLVLSPRGCFVQQSDRRKQNGITSCNECKSYLKMNQVPRFSIVNGNYVGTPPQCLLELTDVELAFLTPVKTYGYCFMFTGGYQKQLKGTLCFFKVQMESIARTAAHFDVLGLGESIVIMMSGKMTEQQKKIVKKKKEVRKKEILKALEWLILYQREWREKNIDLDKVKEKLKKTNPILIDNSYYDVNPNRNSNNNDGAAIDQAASTNNIESEETFEVYFPDGTVHTSTGGQKSAEDFKEAVQSAKAAGFNVEIHANLRKEAVSDYKESNLVNACLLQFPFGRGGLNTETREAPDGSMRNYSAQEYINYLSRLSQPHFHTQLFSLILYNYLMKDSMVRTAFWKSRSKLNANMLGTELTAEGLAQAIAQKQSNNNEALADNIAGQNYLKAIDAVARSVPHTNMAAKQARQKGEAIQHRFGTASYFLTVTPDDEGNMLIQIYSQEKIDDGEVDVDTLTNDELANRAKKRKELRINAPGICAWVFEMVLDAVIEHVIGWDNKTNKGRADGLFGTCQAFTISVEEQCTKRLHMHIQVWVKEFNEMREKLFGKACDQKKAEEYIVEKVDSISSCSLLSKIKDSRETLNHHCRKRKYTKRKRPTMQNDQVLRSLRHRQGYADRCGIIAYCPNCTQTWTSQQMVKSYLKHDMGIDALPNYPDREAKRLKAMIIAQQQQCSGEIDERLVNAEYDVHEHTKTSCFCKLKKLKKKNGDGDLIPISKSKKRKRDWNVECRYRYPKKARKYTAIQNAGDKKANWFFWNGKHKERNIKEIVLKRHKYDIFQNQSCPAIGSSKLAIGNTNISAITEGPVGQYSFKYNLKGTQEDDSSDFRKVIEQMNAIFSKLDQNITGNTKKLFPRREAARRILIGSFAHQKNDIVGAPMSSFLVRNKTRFFFSHESTWIPLRDMETLLQGGKVQTIISQTGNTSYYMCSALNYICRPEELKNTSAYDFFCEYEVIRKTRKTSTILPMFNHGNFIHPSWRKKSNNFLQGARKRKRPTLARVFQYAFPDTAEFQGGLFDPSIESNAKMEEYCKLAVMLFKPFRTLDDLTVDGSFRKALIEAKNNSDCINSTAINFLQNIQNTAYNSFRVTNVGDELERKTVPYHHDDRYIDMEDEDYEVDKEEEEAPVLEGNDLDLFIQALNENSYASQDNMQSLPSVFSSKKIKDKGVQRCGYSCLAEMKPDIADRSSLVQVSEEARSNIDIPSETIDTDNSNNEHCEPRKADIVKVLLTKTNRKTQGIQLMGEQSETKRVLEANGSVKSIVDWAKKAGLDKSQRTAFEKILGSFLLTFYQNNEDDDDRRLRHCFLKNKTRLNLLTYGTRAKKKQQLIALMHGPGGSGKTTVIDLVMKYAQEYCTYLEYEFTSRTIVVTAMSGVAATALLGETAHSAMHLNQKRQLEVEQIERWEETRLVVIDEISFASKSDIEKIENRLKYLKSNLGEDYGGLNVVFAGDFRQLEPVGENKKALFNVRCREFDTLINCYLELDGMHRFKDDPEWGKILKKFRDGTVTRKDIEKINNAIVHDDEKSVLPDNLKYATFYNRDRDSINAALFEKAMERKNEIERKRDGLIIFSDNVRIRNGSKIFVPHPNPSIFWENAAENDIKLSGRSRRDPVLRLYMHCRLMLPNNKDVPNGQANGSQLLLTRVMLKARQTPQLVEIKSGVKVPAVRAGQVAYIEVMHENPRISPRKFKLLPEEFTFKTELPSPIAPHSMNLKEGVTMKAVQLPVIINNATTGHKLQGSSVDQLFIHNWSYVQNWVYVMLSRVRTMKGLYARKPLSLDLKHYQVSNKYKRLIKELEKRKPNILTEEDYHILCE